MRIRKQRIKEDIKNDVGIGIKEGNSTVELRKIFLSVKWRSKFVIKNGPSAAILQLCSYAVRSGVMNVTEALTAVCNLYLSNNPWQLEVTGYDYIYIVFSNNLANKPKVCESILGYSCV